MQMSQLIQRLGRNDLKVIVRDRFMAGMFVFVVYIGVVLRYLLPWLNGYLAKQGILPGKTISMSLADAYPLIIAFFVVFQGALMAGVIFGFLLLDEKDDNTLTAMLVTPVPLSQYVAYKVMLPTALGFVFVIGQILCINQALIPFWKLLLIAAGASLTAPIGALFFGTFAENKVQGFAITKFTGIAGWVILIGWFVGEPWQWLFGLFPPFWISKAYWMVLEGRGWWWGALLIGIVMQLGLLVWMTRRFRKMAYETHM